MIPWRKNESVYIVPGVDPARPSVYDRIVVIFSLDFPEEVRACVRGHDHDHDHDPSAGARACVRACLGVVVAKKFHVSRLVLSPLDRSAFVSARFVV